MSARRSSSLGGKGGEFHFTALYRADRRTFRKSRSHGFVLRMNPEQVVRRVPAHLGKILGLAPKRMR